MRTGILAALFLSTLPAWGQGTVYFANRITGVLDAPVTYNGFPIGRVLTDASQGWVAQLYQVFDTSAAAVGDPIPFHNSEAGAGYWPGAMRTLTGVPENGTAIVKVVAWASILGSTYEAAKSRGPDGWDESEPFPVVTGGGINPPGNLTGLKSFDAFNFPEPSAGALAATGAVLLLLGRRPRPGGA